VFTLNARGLKAVFAIYSNFVCQSFPHVLPSRPGGGNAGGGISKGKGKKGKTPPMPQALRNNWHRTGTGDSLRFAYNLGGCDSARDGERCPKGWHLCAEPKCLQPHGLSRLSNHPKKASTVCSTNVSFELYS